jgi:hypothetical protein
MRLFSKQQYGVECECGILVPPSLRWRAWGDEKPHDNNDATPEAGLGVRPSRGLFPLLAPGRRAGLLPRCRADSGVLVREQPPYRRENLAKTWGNGQSGASIR